MPVFEYTALDTKGKMSAGIIDAESSFTARQKLRASKFFPVSIKEVSEPAAVKAPSRFSSLRSFRRVRASEISMMTRQLATLVNAGFPLVSAIDTLIPQTKSQLFKKILAQIKDSIVEGNSFASALSLYPGVFSSLFRNMVRAGETSGTLEIVLERLADIMENQQALKNRIRSAMAYPVLMVFVGAAVLFFLLTFIVPTITSIFKDMNQTLPAPTIFLISISDLFKLYWWTLVIAAVGLGVAFKSAKNTKKGRYFLDKTILMTPGIGVLTTKLAVSRFARVLGSLLENGISMLPALEIGKTIAGNILISNTIENAAKEVGKGQGLGNSLSGNHIFPMLSIQMIQVGEQSGELESMLAKVADVYENEVESTIMSMTSLLEPIMILIMAAVVLFIVLSICLPIFEMNQLVL